jgi:hypothetical protein
MGAGQQAEDRRACMIRGPAFPGVESLIRAQIMEGSAGSGMLSRRTTKMLMIHGIGSHVPGYSTRFAENLTRSLGLTVTERTVKEMDLQDESLPGERLGHLAVRRFFNPENRQELLFYELTWSSITEHEKQAIAYDSSGEYAFRRANLNNLMKEFLNDHISDPMIYLGNAREKVVKSVYQAMCWMAYGDWQDLEPSNTKACVIGDSTSFAKQLAEDDYAFVTHSMGSRIIVDAWQAAIELIQASEMQNALAGVGSLGPQEIRNVQTYLEEYKKKDLQLFMLANQLPLLELGRAQPSVTRQIDDYCRTGAPKFNDRLFHRLSIVAFNDPNDLLSYPLPPKYADERMDSRVCPTITNITLNVAKVSDVLGVGQVANPLHAHTGYDNDDRVIALISKGISQTHADPFVMKQCQWLEVVEPQ